MKRSTIMAMAVAAALSLGMTSFTASADDFGPSVWQQVLQTLGVVGSGAADASCGASTDGVVGSGFTTDGVVGSGYTTDGVVGSGYTTDGVVGSGFNSNTTACGGASTDGVVGSGK